ncbi:MAG: hypothetical protein WA869_34830 [Alloacidobacterium sp.]|jgi:hypothetical protein
MRIDRTHRPWLIGSCVFLGLLLLIYIPYALWSTKVGGGTPLGIFYGVIGFGFMLFAAALGIRKRFPIWRIGRAQHWMRGHLWLGTMALPIIFLHGAFHFGGWLTTLLMVLLIFVTISGLVGAYLQHTLPTRMMHEVGYETIYDQIDHIRQGLVAEAEQRYQSTTEEMAPGTGMGATVVLTYIDTVPELTTELAQYNAFYKGELKPYLENLDKHSKLKTRDLSAAEFARVRSLLPERGHKTLQALEEICEEKRQLDHQIVIHRTLHGWLLCHIPLSLALILLGFIHAIGALRY